MQLNIQFFARIKIEYLNQISEIRERKMQFENAGKPWNSDEEGQLIKEYSINMMSLMDICKIHGRNYGGITSRLKSLGLVKNSLFVRGYSEYLKSDVNKEYKEKRKEKSKPDKLDERIIKLKIELERLEKIKLSKSEQSSPAQSPQTPTKNAFEVLMSPKKMTKSNYIIYKGEENENAYRLQFDGKSEPNPGPSSAGAVIHYPNSEAVKAEVGEWIPNATNNEAEYKSLLIGLELAIQLGIKNILIAGDSNLVINQVFGDWKVKSENLREVNMKIKNLFKNFDFIAAKHVYRERNAYADNITNVVHEKKKGYLMKDGLYRQEIIIKGQVRELWSDEA
jgi:ribonuclease HI